MKSCETCARSTYDAALGIRMDRAVHFRIEDGNTGKRLGRLVVTGE